ncbi:AmmeMemoRadiSam system protein B [Sulfuriflexus sp.]|uniref:AmmeMemoRadiSam system protein B n=1 Tax=Sulfuriflexus sp. TaxID=2015443 RepID=UPI0028CC7BBB|nr:AmmeMemoRadiSam system protein B [Sulfuriflexus sp.]MDT8404366.1 AmmeMemoRadiSam system protein B [Sulfuriflexus sp.]
MEIIREAAVAGLFYPADPAELDRQLDEFLAKAGDDHKPALALIVPHAGYVYSGPVAARAYTHLFPLHDKVRKVALLGPAHRVGFHGIAMSSADYFVTPLGQIPLDHEARQDLLRLPQVQQLDQAHADEHCLEVQLPFLQKLLGDFSLIPLVVGDADAVEVAEVIEQLWRDEHTLVVISTDLSHYHDYLTAQQLDQNTCSAIESLEPDAIGYDQACGRNALNGLLTVAKRRHLHVHTLDLRNSGDTAGPRDRVVGYGAWMLTD